MTKFFNQPLAVILIEVLTQLRFLILRVAHEYFFVEPPEVLHRRFLQERAHANLLFKLHLRMSYW